MKSLQVLMAAAFSIMATAAFSQEKAGRKDTAQHLTLYTCPKHPTDTSGKAGYCSRCGMKLELSPKERMKRDITKNYTCPVHADVLSKKAGQCSKCGKDMVLSPKEKMKMEVVKKYTCSMHPEVRSDKPGKCPKCNMDLEKKKENHPGHQQ